MTHFRRPRMLQLSSFVWTLCALPMIGACAELSATWDNSVANWSDPSHWNTPNYPQDDPSSGTLYDAFIGGGTVTLDVDPSINELTLAGGIIKGSHTITVVGGVVLVGTVHSASIIAGGGLTFSGGTALTLDAAFLTIPSGATSSVGFVSSKLISLSNGASFSNAGSMTATLGGISVPASSGLGSFTNSGNFTLSGTNAKYTFDAYSATPSTGLTFSNSGNLFVTTGTLAINALGTSSGSCTISSGATLTLQGAFTFTNTSFLTGAGALTIPDATTVNMNGNSTFTGNTTLSVAGSAVVFGGTGQSMGAFSGAGTLTVNAGASVSSDAVRITGPLILKGTLAIHSNGSNTSTSKVTTMTLAGSAGNWTGGLDLTNNKFIVEPTASTKASVLSLLASQVSYGLTHTAGIYSSTLAPHMMVAVIDNNSLPTRLTTFGGQSVDANSLLLTEESAGDANLDGIVNISDLNIVAAHWQVPVSDWVFGDLNADGIVNIADLNLLAANWQAGAGAGSSFEQLTTAAPEPRLLPFIFATAACLVMRRRPPRRRPLSL